MGEFEDYVEAALKEGMDKISYEYTQHTFGLCKEGCTYCKYFNEKEPNG